MASHSRFIEIYFEQIDQIKDSAIPQNTKLATQYQIKLFKGTVRILFVINLLLTICSTIYN